MIVSAVWSVWLVQADVFPTQPFGALHIEDIQLALKDAGPWVSPDDAGLGSAPYGDVVEALKASYRAARRDA